MIVRVLNVGQFRLQDSHLDRLNACDDAVETALENGDQQGLTTALRSLIQAVVDAGEALPADDLHDSDLIVPDAEATLDEIRAWLADSGSDEGLIPG